MIKIVKFKDMNIYLKVLLVGVAVVSGIQLVRLVYTKQIFFQKTIEVDSINNVITNGKIAHINDSSIIILSRSNTLQYFNWNGEYNYSISLNPNSLVGFYFFDETDEIIGYYYRGKEWFRINENHELTYIEDYPSDIPENPSTCMDFSETTYCLDKTILGNASIRSSSNNIIELETNSTFEILTFIGIVAILVSEILLYVYKRWLKEKI